MLDLHLFVVLLFFKVENSRLLQIRATVDKIHLITNYTLGNVRSMYTSTYTIVSPIYGNVF